VALCGRVMTSITPRFRARALTLAAGLAFGLGFTASSALLSPAHAQWPKFEPEKDQSAATDQPADKDQDAAEATENSAADSPAENSATEANSAPSVNDVDVLKDIDVSQLDWGQLNVDASMLGDGPAAKGSAAKARSSQPATADAGMSWSNRNQANGASAVSVKESVSPFWDARVGADMQVTREPTTMSELLAEKSANGGNLPQSGGSAWAAVTAPGAGVVWDKTAVEARVDPNSDQGKLGTSLSKQVPISDKASITLSNGYNMTQQGVASLPGGTARTDRTYGTDQSATVELSETGTSISAGQTLSTSDDKWQRKIGAEQKLFGGVTISGSIGENGQGGTSKSLSAGYKKSW
jgi:hypothetical protein